jgi:hypothetical protein
MGLSAEHYSLAERIERKSRSVVQLAVPLRWIARGSGPPYFGVRGDSSDRQLDSRMATKVHLSGPSAAKNARPCRAARD